MTARETYSSSVASAETTKKATLDAIPGTFQETVNASGVNVGYNTINGNYTNFAVKTANSTKIASIDSAERTKQASVQAARETLRGTGDTGPF